MSGELFKSVQQQSPATAMRNPFYVRKLGLIEFLCLSVNGSTKKGEQICACDKPQPLLSQGFTAGHVDEIHSFGVEVLMHLSQPCTVQMTNPTTLTNYKLRSHK